MAEHSLYSVSQRLIGWLDPNHLVSKSFRSNTDPAKTRCARFDAAQDQDITDTALLCFAGDCEQ